MNTVALASEEEAFQSALNYSNASLYRWQNPMSERQIKEVTHNPNATWYPTAELMIAPLKGNFKPESFRLAYRFDIYADQPLKRNYVFVDATTGGIIMDQNRIMDVNRPATATTQYSGVKPIMTDSLAGHYRLEESGRGLGIMTYNNQTNNNPQNVDFINATTSWNQVNAALDQYATDAHYGAEKTYDFYDSTFNRNSIDNAGLALLSYVHVQVNLVNAFWDGTEMNYGDGDATYHPLTSMDVTGHEITHGFTQYTANFAGGNEPGAMNEGFSDCFGISVRHMGQQTPVIDWLIGDQLGGATFRDIVTPANTGNPVCYQGANWDFTTQEVHQNSTPFSHCYYLVAMGGSGTNEFSQTYNITGLGIYKAELIWYRMQSVYNTPNSQYADARANAIQAATDLYGGCSPEVIAVTNAWYAVHVGNAYVATPPVAGFTSSTTNYCSIPSSVPFINSTTNGGTYLWHFGDGDTSTMQSPTHIYNTVGTYTVKLNTSSACGTDSLTRTLYININPPAAPTAASPDSINCNAIATLVATGTDTMKWYSQPSGGNPIAIGNTYITPQLTSNATYYVSSQIASAPDFCPPATNAIVSANGSYFTGANAHYLSFDVHQPCTLVSVLVYAGAAGNRTINLYDAAANLLNTATINIPNGTSTVTLNFPLNVGTGYQLSCGGTLVNLYRNATGASFPYTDPNGYVSITGNDVPDAVHYYYFYNWKLQGPSCISARTPVNVIIKGPTASFTQSQIGNTVTFTNTSTNSTSWLWNFGDNTATSAQQNPVHTYTIDGTYTITLYAYNGLCVDSTTQQVTIITTGLNPNNSNAWLSVLPNPVSDNLVINLNTIDSGREWKVLLLDILGQTVANEKMTSIEGNKQLILNLSSLAKGIYTLELQNNGNKLIRKIVKD